MPNIPNFIFKNFHHFFMTDTGIISFIKGIIPLKDRNNSLDNPRKLFQYNMILFPLKFYFVYKLLRLAY